GELRDGVRPRRDGDAEIPGRVGERGLRVARAVDGDDLKAGQTDFPGVVNSVDVDVAELRSADDARILRSLDAVVAGVVAVKSGRTRVRAEPRGVDAAIGGRSADAVVARIVAVSSGRTGVRAEPIR